MIKKLWAWSKNSKEEISKFFNLNAFELNFCLNLPAQFEVMQSAPDLPKAIIDHIILMHELPRTLSIRDQIWASWKTARPDAREQI